MAGWRSRSTLSVREREQLMIGEEVLVELAMNDDRRAKKRERFEDE